MKLNKTTRKENMSLDVSLMKVQLVEVFSANITHNLGVMAKEAGIYKHLWSPAEINITYAAQLIKPLKAGLELMKKEPERFKKFDAENGWGTYKQFVSWVEDYIKACKQYPNAKIEVDA
jgi:hypothetical protein